jgi:hypothetical protein
MARTDTRELKVIEDFYGFMVWLVERIEKFPRHHRYSLGIAMENRLQELLALLLRAKYSRVKAGVLEDVNMELEVLRFQIRMATDLKALPVKSQGHAARELRSIGSQVGGWLKSRGGEPTA